MTPRGFLRFLAFVPLVGPGAVKALVTAAPPVFTPSHPLFSGALGLWEGVVLHESNETLKREMAKSIDCDLFPALTNDRYLYCEPSVIDALRDQTKTWSRVKPKLGG